MMRATRRQRKLQIYRLLGALRLHPIGTDGKDCEMQMAYFLGIVIWLFSIKVELLVGHCWSPCCRFFNEKRFNFVKDWLLSFNKILLPSRRSRLLEWGQETIGGTQGRGTREERKRPSHEQSKAWVQRLGYPVLICCSLSFSSPEPLGLICNKNALSSVDSRLLGDETRWVLLSKAPVLLYYFFVWNTPPGKRVLHVIMYILQKKNCKERQTAHLSLKPV